MICNAFGVYESQETERKTSSLTETEKGGDELPVSVRYSKLDA